MKLFDTIRIEEKIDGPKKRYRKPKVSDEDKPKVKYTLLREGDKSGVDEFIALYKNDPYKARVKFFNGKRNAYCFSRLVMFEYENGDFQICNFTVSFGISVTNRMYSTQRKISSLIYSKKKFWIKNGSVIKPLTYGSLCEFVSNNEISLTLYDIKKRNEKLEKSLIYNIFSSRFHWIRVLSEYEYSNYLTFNTVVSKKLFGIKDLNRELFGVPYNISLILQNSSILNGSKIDNRGKNRFVGLREMLKVLIHVDHLREDMVKSHYFIDTCKMAKTLGKKVNCKWGLKRLTQEHDNWAKLITQIELDCISEYEMNIRPIYHSFAEFSGYRILKTNKDMLMEGMFQKHCVGTYINDVDKGNSAIFHVKGYTLQLSVEENREIVREVPRPQIFGNGNIVIPESRVIISMKLVNKQFRGKNNKNAPSELVQEVQEMVDAFGSQYDFYANEEDNNYRPNNSNRANDLHQIQLNAVNRQEDVDEFEDVDIYF
jgi:hypothetical protein